MTKISPELQTEINQIAKEGDAEANKGNWAGQIERYKTVWEMIPEPKNEWDGGTWIIGGIAEAFYQLKDFAQAKKFFQKSLDCYRGEENSFLQLRLGQIFFDAGSLDEARIHLKKAWDLSEGRAFTGEPKKYREFLLKVKN